MRLPSDSKSPRPVSRRGLDCCDDIHMQVICPTAQVIFRANNFYRPRLIEALNRRRVLFRRQCLGGFGLRGFSRRRRRNLRCGLLLRSGLAGSRCRCWCRAGKARLCCGPGPRSRIRPPDSPRMCDRGTRGESDHRTRHRADRSKDDRARYRTNGGISGTALSYCLNRNK
jgi:hypothetical protein